MIEYVLSLSLLILVVLLVRGIFRKTVSPRAIYALWLVVVIRMLLPITLFEINVTLPEFLQNQQTEQVEQWEQSPEQSETPNDVQEHLPPTSTEQTTPTTPDYPSVITPITPITPATPGETTPVTPSTPVTDPEEVITPEEPIHEVPEESASLNWKQIVNLVWLCGAGIVGAWILFTTVTYNRRLYKDRKLHRTVGGTKVYISESAGVPCISGFIPSIYITPQVANSKSEALIIIHEHIHLRHGDHIWSVIRALALIAFWWNPLVWIAATVSKQDAELACDDAISVKLNDDGRLKYANILLDTVPQNNRYGDRLSSVIGLGSAPLKKRILMLTKKQKNRLICIVLAAVLALSAVGCSFIHLTDNPDDATSDSRIGIVTENLSDFLTEEQIALYEKAGVIYPLFNGNSDSINILHLMLEGASFEEQQEYSAAHNTGDEEIYTLDDGTRYHQSYGEYDTFDEFKALCVSVFTKEYFEELNQGSRYSSFIDHNDKLYNIDAAKGSAFGYAPDEFPDKYELVEMSDEVIVFKIIGHYKSSNVDPDFTVTTKTFTAKMVKSENGWRFAKFAHAGIDEAENRAYIRHGINVVLPEAYLSSAVSITPVEELYDHTIAEFYQAAVKDQGIGWLFSIVRHEESKLLCEQTNHTGFLYFATDGKYWYGIMRPSDVQLDLSNEELMKEYQTLFAEMETVIRTILVSNPQLSTVTNEDAYRRYSELITTQGPFIGYVANKDTPWIDLYTEINGTWVGKIPYEIFHDWPATDREYEGWTPGWMSEYTCFYYAEFGDFCWAAVHLGDTVLGNGRKNIATSADGGKTWDVGSTMDDYGGNHVLAMGFISDKIAFMSFDPDNEFYDPDNDGVPYTGPAISRTTDGGKTWERLEFPDHAMLANYKLKPWIPFYEGEMLLYPIVLYNHGEPMDEVFLMSYDNGLTWEWGLPKDSSALPTDEEILAEYEKATKLDDIFALAISELVGNVDTAVDKPIKIGDIHYFESKKYSSFDELRNELLTVFSEEITDEMLDTEHIRNVDGKLYAVLADGGDSAPISYRNEIEIIPISENKLTLRVTVKITDDYLRTYGYYASGQIIDTVNIDFTYEKIGDNWVFTEFPYIRGVYDSKLREKYTEYEFDFGKLVLPAKYDGKFTFKSGEGKYLLTITYDPYGDGQYSDDQVFKIWRIPLGEEIPKKDGLTVTNAIGYDDKYVYMMTSGVSSRRLTYETDDFIADCAECVTVIMTYMPHANGWQYFGVLEHLIPIEQNTIHQSILENKVTVYSPDSKSDVLLSDYLKSSELEISKYIVLDLDENGAHETILWLEKGENEYLGFLILNNKNEKTYAHLLYYRQFADLKTDGTFSFSGGVSNHGIGRIRFTGDTYTVDKIAYCESADNRNISYYVENQSVSKEIFDAYIAIHSQKVNVSWFDYTFDT